MGEKAMVLILLKSCCRAQALRERPALLLKQGISKVLEVQRSEAQISSFFLDPVHRNKRARKGTASSPGKTLFSVSPSTLKHIVQVPKISTVSTDQSQASQVYSFLAVLSSTEKGGQRMTLPFISKQNPRINITRLWTESPATALTPTPHPTLAPPQSLLDPATHSSDHLFFQSPAFPMKTPPLEPKCPSLLASWRVTEIPQRGLLYYMLQSHR